MIGVLVLGNIAGLLATHVAGRPSIHGLVPLFDLDQEESFGTWVAAALLAWLALLAYDCGVIERRDGGRWTRNWWLVVVAAALMSIDEVAAVHELTSAVVREALGADGVFFFAWVLPALALVVVFGLVQLRFVRYLPLGTRWGLLGAAAVFVLGAVGFEFVESALFTGAGREATPALGVVSLVQEALELTGVAAAVVVLRAHLARYGYSVAIMPSSLGGTAADAAGGDAQPAVDQPAPQGGRRPTGRAPVEGMARHVGRRGAQQRT